MKKTCPKCKIEKDLDSFGLNRNKKNGRNSYCILCAKIVNMESRIRRSEHRKKYNYLLRLLDPENVKICSRKSYLKHREKRLAQQNKRDKLKKQQKVTKSNKP